MPASFIRSWENLTSESSVSRSALWFSNSTSARPSLPVTMRVPSTIGRIQDGALQALAGGAIDLHLAFDRAEANDSGVGIGKSRD